MSINESLPRQESNSTSSPSRAARLAAAVEPRGQRSYTATLSPLERHMADFNESTPPDELAKICWTVHANSPEEAAALYAADYDPMVDFDLTENDGELWVEVRDAVQPDAKPKLYRVVCGVVPRYTYTEASEADLERYQELLLRLEARAKRSASA